jgi:hypothetical protein
MKKSEIRKKFEIRKMGTKPNLPIDGELIRDSEFGILSAFGLRPSDFSIHGD